MQRLVISLQVNQPNKTVPSRFEWIDEGLIDIFVDDSIANLVIVLHIFDCTGVTFFSGVWIYDSCLTKDIFTGLISTVI